jgi:hypothetical protein
LFFLLLIIFLSSSITSNSKYVTTPQALGIIADDIQKNSSVNTTAATTGGFLTYENPTYGIKIQYPTDWEKKEPTPYEVVFRFPPQENTSGTSSKYLLIIVNTLDPQENMTLDQLTHDQIDFLKESFSDLTLNESESNATNLAGNPAYKVTFDHRNELQQGSSPDYKLIQIWTIKGDKVYYITYRAELGRYSDDYLQTIQKMIDSFEISDFLLYENPTLGIKIQYPTDWKKVEPADQYYLEGNIQYPTVSFLSPLENASEVFIENFTISVENLPQNTTINAYSNETIKAYKAKGFDLIESNATNLAGNPAYKVTFDHRNELQQANPDYKLLQIWTIKGDRLYRITFQADAESYAEFLPIAQKMIDSFEISDFLLYENPTLGIKIQYPTDWKKGGENGNITFIAPIENNLGIYHDNVILTTKRLSKNITLDEYAGIFTSQLKKNATDHQIIEENTTTIGGNTTAYKIAFTTKDGQHDLKVMVVLTIKDDRVYLIEYRSDTEAFSNNLATVQKMIDSFEIETGSLTGSFFGLIMPAPLLGIPSPLLPPLGAAVVPAPSPISPLEDNETMIA